MKFSLVIPLAPYRNAEILDSIKKLDYPKSQFHVIVVKSLNASDNRNKGAEKAKGEIIAFLDDDAILDKDYLKNAEKFFEEHPEIDIMGGPQLRPLDEKGFAKISDYALSSKFGAWNMSKRYSIQKESLDVDETAITSANLFCKRKVMDKVKFDIKLWPGEDPKFIEDAKKAGLKVAYSPEIILYHRRRATIKAMIKQIFNYGKVRPFKESFFKTMKMPFFFIPSIFLIYLIFMLLEIIYNPKAIKDAVNSYAQLNPSISAIIFLPLIIYVLLALMFSIYDSIRNKDLKSFFFLPFIYPLIHLSYGAGMLWGYVKKRFKDSSVG